MTLSLLGLSFLKSGNDCVQADHLLYLIFYILKQIPFIKQRAFLCIDRKNWQADSLIVMPYVLLNLRSWNGKVQKYGL